MGERVADRPHDRERAVESALGEVVEEDAADAARLAPVLQVEVVVARLLPARVQVRAERRDRVAAGAVEVDRVLVVAVVRRQVHASAEPPHRIGVGARRDEHAHVHVHGRRVRIAGMQDERHARRLPCAPREIGTVRRRGRRQRRAADVGEIHAPALEHGAVLDQARDAAAAFRTIPRVAQERPAVDRLEPRDDALLQAGEIGADRGDVHGDSAASGRRTTCVPRRGGRCRCGTACRRSGSRRSRRTRRAAPASRNRPAL